MMYKATSLEDIAKLFDDHAEIAWKQSKSGTKINQAVFKREWVTWKSAADLLRNTEIIPKTTGGSD